MKILNAIYDLPNMPYEEEQFKQAIKDKTLYVNNVQIPNTSYKLKEGEMITEVRIGNKMIYRLAG